MEAEVHELNGQPALVFYDEDAPFAALLLAVADESTAFFSTQSPGAGVTWGRETVLTETDCRLLMVRKWRGLLHPADADRLSSVRGDATSD